jgi:hypothetical protein
MARLGGMAHAASQVEVIDRSDEARAANVDAN